MLYYSVILVLTAEDDGRGGPHHAEEGGIYGILRTHGGRRRLRDLAGETGA